MKSKLFSVLLPLVVALVFTASPTYAKVYSPAQFKAELTKRIGKKKGNAAAIQAAAILNVALSDRRNKTRIAAYTTAVIAATKKPIAKNLKGSAANRLVRALTVGYFKGRAFDLNDARYTAALKKILNIVPAGKRTAVVSRTIYNTLKQVAGSYDVSSDVVYAYFLRVKQSNYPTPVS